MLASGNLVTKYKQLYSLAFSRSHTVVTPRLKIRIKGFYHVR